MQRSQGTTDYENLGINKTLTTCTADKLRLGYPELIIFEEIPF